MATALTIFSTMITIIICTTANIMAVLNAHHVTHSMDKQRSSASISSQNVHCGKTKTEQPLGVKINSHQIQKSVQQVCVAQILHFQ